MLLHALDRKAHHFGQRFAAIAALDAQFPQPRAQTGVELSKKEGAAWA